MKKLNEVIKQTEERINEIESATAAELAELKAKKEEAQQQSETAYEEMKRAASSGDTKLYMSKRAERDSAEAVVEMCDMRIADLEGGASVSDEDYNRMVGELLEAMDRASQEFKAFFAAFIDKAEIERRRLLDGCAKGNDLIRQLHAIGHKPGKPSECTSQYMPCEIIAFLLRHGGVQKIREECRNEDK